MHIKGYSLAKNSFVAEVTFKHSKDENDIEVLMLTQDKNLRCITILTSKLIIASLGNSGEILVYGKKMLKCFRWEYSIESSEKYQLCLLGNSLLHQYQVHVV